MIPNNFKDMIQQCKLFNKTELYRISNYSYSEVNTFIDNSFKRVQSFVLSSDQKQIIKSCYMVYCLNNLRPDMKGKLIAEINKIRPNIEKNKQVQILVSFVSTHLYQKSESYAALRELERCLKSIQNQSDLIGSAYFLFFLAKYARKIALLNSSFFLKLVVEILTVKNLDVVKIAAKALSAYLEILENKYVSTFNQTSQHLIEIAMKNLSNDFTKLYLSLFIFKTLLKKKQYHLFKSPEIFFKTLMFISRINVMELHSESLSCFVLAVPINIEFFKSTYLENVMFLLTADNSSRNMTKISASSYIKLLSYFPEYLSTVAEKNFQILRTMLCPNGIKQGFKLLQMLAEKQPNYITKNIRTICSIISSTNLNSDFIEYVPKLFFEFPNLWNEYCKSFIIKIRTDITKNPNVLHLELLARCPPIDNMDLTNALLSLLKHENYIIRSYVPAAIFKHSSALDKKSINELIYKLLTFALSENEAIIRKNILKSFPEFVIQYLTTDTSIQCLEILSNDEDFSVRKNAIQLLSKISPYAPFKILPIFRRVLLDNLFLLSSPKSNRLRKEMSKLLLIVVVSAELILPIYS